MFKHGLRVELLHLIAKILGIRFHIDGIGFGKPKDLKEYEDLVNWDNSLLNANNTETKVYQIKTNMTKPQAEEYLKKMNREYFEKYQKHSITLSEPPTQSSL